ncbi:hypothetical protein AMTRI_Chr04g253150 [Amborella trichopoda]
MASTALPLNPTHLSSPGTQISDSPSPPSLSLLSRCATLSQLKQIQANTIKTHLQNHAPTLSKLASFCSLSLPEHIEYAQQLFDQIPEPNTVLFNTLIRSYSRSHTPIQAINLFVKMLTNNIQPDNYTFPSILKACAMASALEEGRALHCHCIKLELDSNIFVQPTLIRMYADCGAIESAQKVFNATMKGRSVVLYNSMITAYVQRSRPNEALALFREMQAHNTPPNDVTVLSVLSACSLLGAVDLGKWVHEFVKKNGLDMFVKVNTALIDMYAKCGSIEDAKMVFEKMPFRDTQAWSAMIVAFAIHGQGEDALTLFRKMETQRIKPDDITFLGVLYACSHTGLIDEGRRYFESMKRVYGVTAGIKHYGCMVDLLGRAGLLNEAYSFIKSLPIKPTPILWRTLLAACGVQGNVELGKRVAEHIFEHDQEHGGDYVILSNMCAQAGKWDDVNSIRKLMFERGVTKVPGCSSIEVDNVVHEFFSGDGNHPQAMELHSILDELMKQLKLGGYIPQTSLVFHVNMGEEEKEATLRYHSEKLAMAFGLINTAPGSTMRIVKNLRVCADCHSVAKLVSKIFDREIILRDLHRFHYFRGGSCSCGDYW